MGQFCVPVRAHRSRSALRTAIETLTSPRPIWGLGLVEFYVVFGSASGSMPSQIINRAVAAELHTTGLVRLLDTGPGAGLHRAPHLAGLEVPAHVVAEAAH